MGAIQKLNDPISDELRLVRAAKAGDISAFESLIRTNTGAIQVINELRVKSR